MCENGKIQCEAENIKRYLLYDKDSAIEYVNVLQNLLRNKCEKDRNWFFHRGWTYIWGGGRIGIQRQGKPRHLFTYEELEKQLRNGDDSKNNRLVIDANGYVKLVEECAYPYLYPVR